MAGLYNIKRIVFGGDASVAVSPYLANMTAYYKLDSATGAADFLENHDGTNFGATSAAGLVDESFVFDGISQYTKLGTNAGITGYPFTIYMAVFLPDVSTNRVLLSGSETTAYHGITLLSIGSSLRIRMGDGGGNATGNRKDVQTSTSSLNAATWNVITLCCNAFNDFDLTINKVGRTLSNISGTATSISFSGNYELGRDTSSSVFYDYSVDEVGFWNGRVMSLEEREEMYDNTLAGLSILSASSITPPVDILNDGNNGDNTSNLISRLTVTNALNGDLVILMIGVNDWRHPTGSKRRTPAQYKANLITIVQSYQAAGSDVLLVSFMPILDDETDIVCSYYGESSGCDVNATGAAFLTAIDEVVISESTAFLDINALFVTEGQPTTLISSYMQNTANTGSPDGVHNTIVGAEFLAQKVTDYYTAQGYTYINIVCVGDSTTNGFNLTGEGGVTGDTYPAKLKTLLNA